MPDDLQAIVQRMVAAGEPEENIALVIQHSKAQAQAPVQEAAKPEERSVGGFMSNALSSGGKFLSDTVSAIPSLAKLATAGVLASGGGNPVQVGRIAAKMAPGVAKGALEEAKARYGGVEQIKNTLYTDPVGVLADASTVLGGTGLAAKLGGAEKVARLATAASELTNPARIFEPAAKAVEYGTAGLIRPMLKPSKILRRQQDAPLEIERTALKSGAVTEGLARGKQREAVDRATAAAAGATDTVPRETIVSMPKSLGQVEKGLSHDSDLAALADVESNAVRSLPENVAASDLLDKRRALDRELNAAFRAAERGGAPTGIRQTGQKEMLGNIRGALRQAAPDIRQADDEARRLGMVRSAIEESKLRAGDIPMGAALLGGGLAAGGVPGAGLLGAMFGIGRTFPQVPLAVGSVPVRGAAALAQPASMKAALLARLLGQEQEQP